MNTIRATLHCFSSRLPIRLSRSSAPPRQLDFFQTTRHGQPALEFSGVIQNHDIRSGRHSRMLSSRA